jgi:V/A-type H+-transporting ATPase subunit C
MKNRASPLNYSFAVGKIRALEKFLIAQSVFEEAIEQGLSEALRLFVESDLYSDELLQIKDSSQLEIILSKEKESLKEFINKLILDKDLLGLLEPDLLDRIESILKAYPSPFLEDYFMHLIDMHNIKTFLRLYTLKEPQGSLKKYLSYEGFIKRKDFLKLYTQDLSAFLNRLEYVHKHNLVFDYAFFLREAIIKIEKEDSFVLLEKAISDFLIQILRLAKYLAFGPEPILAYYFAKVNELNLIRMIILAKLNNIPVDLPRDRLNLVYA